MSRCLLSLLFFLTALPCAFVRAEVKPLRLVLPTRNRAIFSESPSRFYQYVDRTFEGRSMQVWQAGKFGYVRNPIRTSSGIVFSKFHEGLDIKPVERDKNGNPLDVVRSISDGRVVYVSKSAYQSSYGKYVVIEHDWGYGLFFSLYAHLANATAEVGDKVSPGSPIGKMGYTGPGLDRTRAHLHIELNMILQSKFGKWHDQAFKSPNYHGQYNGLNLIGIDLAGLFHAHARNPKITVSRFVAGMETYFKVTVPRKGSIEVMENYPWMAREMASAKGKPSWEISFSSSGVPLAVRPSAAKVTQATVSSVKYSATPHSYNTRGRLSGSGKTAKLSSSGLRYVNLITGQF